MYFKWGTKDKKVVETTIDSALCPHCAYYQFSIISYISYFYLYWIPIYIRRKKINVICSQCKKEINKKTIPEDFYKRIKSLAFPSYKIAPYYSGIPLILLIIYMSFYLFTYDDNIQHSLMSKPMINDVYSIKYNEIVKDSNNEFGYLKLNYISDNELGFKVSKLSYDEFFESTQDLYNLNVYQDHYYDNKILHIKKLQLIK